MRARIPKTILIGAVVGIVSRNWFITLLTTALLEIISIIAINIFWFIHGYKPLVPGSFMTSVILPNTSPYKEDFSYNEVLIRIYLRSIGLIAIILAPELWLFFLPLILLTLFFYDR